MTVSRASLSRMAVSASVKTLALPLPTAARQLTSVSSVSSFVSMASGASANTAGSWSQIFASTSEECGLLMLVNLGAVFGADNGMMLDIGVGASGSEAVIIPNIAVGGTGLFSNSSVFQFPVRIPASSRVAVRARAPVASRSADPRIQLFKLPNQSLIPTSIDVLGSSTSTSRGTALSGSSGAYTEIVASTTRPYQALTVVPSGATNAGLNAAFRLTLAVGPAGAEVDIGSIDHRQASGGGMQPVGTDFNGGNSFFGAFVPAGSRLAVKHNIASNPQYVEVCIAGVPIA